VANLGVDSQNWTRPYLLRRRIICAVCQQAMWSNPERDRRTYRCSSRATLYGPCGARRALADAVEGWVREQVTAILRNHTIIATELTRRRDEGPDPALVAERETREHQLAKLTQQQARLIRRFRELDDESEGLGTLIKQE